MPPDLWSEALDLTSVSRIGRYKVLDRLATGGMAHVFLAVDEQKDDTKPLVIKRILPNLAQDGTFVRMFLQEARIALCVQHVNVVRLHKLGEHNGLPYLVMEFISGLTFRELEREAHRQGKLIPPGVVVDLMAQACTGAHAVHETVIGNHREIVHRDLCPHNLMIDEEGVVKVLDFGIAKAAMGMDTTRTGVLKGKTAYLAPEQLQRAPVDRRTDIWTLSVVTWEMLARRRMFGELGEYDTMQAISNGQISNLHEVNPQVPRALCEVVHRGLSKDRNQRFDSAMDLAHALRSAAQSAGIFVDATATRSFVREIVGVEDTALGEETTAASDIVLSRSQRFDEQVAAAELPDIAPTPTKPASMLAMVAAIFGIMALVLFVGGAIVGAMLMGPQTPTGEPVRLTFAPEMPPTEMVAELEPLRRDMEIALDRPVIFQVASSYKAAGKLLAQGHTDFAMLPPYLYLDTSSNTPGIGLLALSEHDNTDSVVGVLIARSDFAWTGEDSLRGRSVCFTDNHSTTGYMLPRAWMKRRGVDPDTDLGAIIMSGNHHQLIHDVAEGRCDVGATYSGAMRTAYDVDVPAAQTTELTITGRTPNDAICMGPHTDPGVSAKLRDALMAWDPTVHGGRYVGARLHLTGFRPGDVSAYDQLRKELGLEVAP